MLSEKDDKIEREAEHTLSLPLSFVLKHSGQSVFLSEKKTAQSFYFGHFFLFVLLLSATLCFLSDVMVRLKWSSLLA